MCCRCVNGINDHRCVCVDGYTGAACEININECESSPCRNGGVCNDGVSFELGLTVMGAI